VRAWRRASRWARRQLKRALPGLLWSLLVVALKAGVEAVVTHLFGDGAPPAGP
jgi:hypothetical protein